ncbi:MAG: GGDEF domain-containing protein [Candidatus Thiodiazotropha sp. (ex Lucina aurantia)]|nr:GGDEF domain-containing protein [Candidatus Thiodiazotropha sp. (ex Lucina pensylvanica)]MBT3024003.1 GGDEF domain-containing protein [Candidatus Thiodiazotropha taylori]MBT3044528.1 GGDEF domain-containing protein [Candidatus Thiodiazotropha sp. (ex Codakia orbicularis)]MBV2103913.1 GGDEF domain-containing protein [Candidatus Thiodiazotropha sp. (ex Lucina aurantia)]MBV2098423.1 GGDEF domain-containing protein [Candidatus Thiodiazotropha sp. (ex Codakia orbicularis)]
MDDLNSRHQTEFHLKSTFWLSVTAATLILPFAFYHLTHQHVGIGIGAVITSLSLYLVAWSCHKKTYKTIYTFVWLTPFTTLFVAYLTNLLGITGTYWCYSTLILYYFMMSERQAWISNIIFALVNIPLVWHLFETHEAIRFTVTFSLVSAYSAIFLHIIAIQYSELQKMAITDKLTDVYNRTLLKDSLEQAIHQANRTNTAFTLIIMDVDHFKKINDELGHEIGDHVLMQLGAFLKDFLRDSDKIFRIGGEEFLILLYNTDEANSVDIAEKIRKGIENLSLIPDRTVTVSIGVAGLSSVTDWKQWMKTCDKNLYEAKNSGRNRVAVCKG